MEFCLRCNGRLPEIRPMSDTPVPSREQEAPTLCKCGHAKDMHGPRGCHDFDEARCTCKLFAAASSPPERTEEPIWHDGNLADPDAENDPSLRDLETFCAFCGKAHHRPALDRDCPCSRHIDGGVGPVCGPCNAAPAPEPAPPTPANSQSILNSEKVDNSAPVATTQAPETKIDRLIRDLTRAAMLYQATGDDADNVKLDAAQTALREYVRAPSFVSSEPSPSKTLIEEEDVQGLIDALLKAHWCLAYAEEDAYPNETHIALCRADLAHHRAALAFSLLEARRG